MIKKLFNIEVKLREQKGNTLILCVRSKELVVLLNEKGMVIGKKEALTIPKWIKSNNKFMMSFIRGFTDTDGSLSFKKRYRKVRYYPAISISSKNKKNN